MSHPDPTHTDATHQNPTQPDGRIALIIGATGGIGGAAARALLAHGWQVRGLTRDPDAARTRSDLAGVTWVRGDAMQPDAVVAAARGAALIVHGANPPGYRNWRGLAIPMLAHAIAAAQASGARLVFPGNVYNFGPDAGVCVAEDAPQHPLTRKGAIRVEMEAMLRAAAARGVRSLVLRMGDFFGPHAPSTWFAGAMVRPGRPLTRIVDPGRPGVAHTWAYLPDAGETIARLAAIEDRLADAEVLHFGGHVPEGPGGMADAIRSAAGRPDLPVRRLNWALVYAGAPFVTFLREMIEMRYLWREPLRLDNRRLRGLLGQEPHTKLDVALRDTLGALGCL